MRATATDIPNLILQRACRAGLFVVLDFPHGMLGGPLSETPPLHHTCPLVGPIKQLLHFKLSDASSAQAPHARCLSGPFSGKTHTHVEKALPRGWQKKQIAACMTLHHPQATFCAHWGCLLRSIWSAVPGNPPLSVPGSHCTNESTVQTRGWNGALKRSMISFFSFTFFSFLKKVSKDKG